MTPIHRKAGAVLALAGVLAVVAGCGKAADTGTGGSTAGGGGAGTTAANAPTDQRSITTPAPTGDYTQPLVWGVYRETNSLDPIFAFDYPENTVLFNICEAVLEQQPDGTITDGLGTVTNPDPKTYVITLKDGVKFWDGTPLTAEDVVYSLGRARDPKLGGFYPQVFTRVKDIKATGPSQVTITLTQPDTWLRGELSGPAGVVLEKAYVEKQGQKYGTVDGGAE